MKKSLSGKVADEEGSCTALAAERPGSQSPFVVTIEGDAKVLHVNERLTGRLAHDLNGILVSQEVATFYCVVCVIFPLIATVC